MKSYSAYFIRTEDFALAQTSTAGRKSKVKSQKSKLIYNRLFGD